MDSGQLALVMVAGIWAALNTLVSAYKVINEKRDIIVTGRFNGEDLSLAHRRLMLQNDWIPLKFGIAVVSLLFALVLYSVPYLTNEPSALLRLLASMSALGPFASFAAFSILGLRDYKFIKKTLANVKTIEISED